ncbi:TadE family type IV pilus minor pilin [Streptomonospora salina]|uniref:Pilus assembly protein TadE n=1 Tax=Streptomonospora salina TaxID=104205 RepID=A0A841ECZ2_9ACTN|nr:TadE family type IV pilus minor pilin [Streptomonospora salina]MBB5998933.1 hypothetical protein [Streptomonospora salina]
MTAETAAALPSLALVLGVALAAIQAAAAHVACVDAARVGARALARGDPEHAVRAAATDTAPGSADVALSEGGGMAHVTVTAPVALGPLIDLPVEARGSAATPLEEAPAATPAPYPAPHPDPRGGTADPAGPTGAPGGPRLAESG